MSHRPRFISQRASFTFCASFVGSACRPFVSLTPDPDTLVGAWLCGDWLHVCGCVLYTCGATLRPVMSSKTSLAQALIAVRDLTYEELRDRYTLEVGQVWTVGGMRTMIRDHYPALFRSMCKSADVHTIGNDTAWAGSYKGAHAFLRGTAGTGKSAFMFVMFIEFLKMYSARPNQKAVTVDGVVVFNPAVASILIQWEGVYGGNAILLREGKESVDPRRLVHLFDAGQNKPVRRLQAGRRLLPGDCVRRPHPLQGVGFQATADEKTVQRTVEYGGASSAHQAQLRHGKHLGGTTGQAQRCGWWSAEPHP